MSILEEFRYYRDLDGLNQLSGVRTQNGTLFTTEYILCIKDHPDVSDQEFDNEVTRVSEVFTKCEPKPGLSVRAPGSKEFDSMDNTSAILTFSALFDGGAYGRRMLKHMRKTECSGPDVHYDIDRSKAWFTKAKILSFGKPKYWNNQYPEEFCFAGWWGRSPGFMGLLKMVAGEWVGPFGQLSVLVGQFLGCFQEKTNTDARKLPYVVWQYLKQRNFIWKTFYKLWCWKLMRDYPRGMKDVYKIYYPEGNPIREHSPIYSGVE